MTFYFFSKSNFHPLTEPSSSKQPEDMPSDPKEANEGSLTRLEKEH
jgi:hypothetical protein